MVERGPRNEPLRNSETILTEDFVKQILHDARMHLGEFGGLPTTLFVLLDNNDHVLFPLAIPETHEEKCAYFGLLGFSIQDSDRQVQEAILVAESWYVGKSEIDVQLDVAPSQHPDRKEAITLVGRDCTGSKSAYAIQPFSRDAKNKPVFEPLEMDQFDGSPPTEHYSTGLLDYLFFPAGRGKLH
jgi:hypothetical protein